MAAIDPTAQVEPGAVIGKDVSIGAYSVIGPNVVIEDGCKLMAHLPVPTGTAFTNPLIYAAPIQLIAYHTAVFMGTDVDQPRNLAKSVTVE